MPYEVPEKKHIGALSKVFQNGKIQVPAEVRKALELKDGDKIVWSVNGIGKWSVEKA